MYEGGETLVDQANKPCALCKRPNEGIQVSCDYCEAYVCESCHWCHKNQTKHNVRICDGCDTFACRACDDMDICEECGQVLCEDCSAMSECSVCHKTFCNDSDCSDSCNKGEDCDSVLCHNCGWICKFCSTVLCEDCSNSCGKCGSVVCKQHAKYLAECETCGLPYCLVCLAQREPCVRCTQVSSKRMEQLVHLRLKSMYKAFKSGDVDNIIATVGSKNEENQNAVGMETTSANAADEAAARLLEEIAAEELKKDSAEKKKVAKKKKKKGRNSKGGAGREAEDKETAPDAPAPNSTPPPGAQASSKKDGATPAAAEAKSSSASKEEEKRGTKAVSPLLRPPSQRKKQASLSQAPPIPNLKLKSSELSDYCQAVLGGLSTTAAEVRARFRGHLDEDVVDLLASMHSDPHDLNRLVAACAEMAGLVLSGSAVGEGGSEQPQAAGRKEERNGGQADGAQSGGRGSRKGKTRSRKDSDLSAEQDGAKEDGSSAGAANVSFMDDPLEARLKDAVAAKSLGLIQSVLDDARGVPGLAALRKSAKKQMKKIAEVLKVEEGGVQHQRHKHVDESAGALNSSYAGGSGSVMLTPSLGSTSSLASITGGQRGVPSAASTGGSMGSGGAANSGNQTYQQREPGMVIDLAPGIVGWVIGRGGVRIKDIQQRSGCKMWVDQDVADEEPRKLYVNGTKEQMDSAAALVRGLIDTAPVTLNNAGATEDVSSQIIDCPPHLVGLLIGRKGWTIKNIQMQSGAQVSINQSVREGTPRKIIVSGTSAAVEAAAEMVRDVLAYPNAIDPEKSSTGDGSDSGSTTAYDFNNPIDPTSPGVGPLPPSQEAPTARIPAEKPKGNNSSNTLNDTNTDAENPWLQQAKAAADAWPPAPQQPAAAAWQKSGGWASNPVITKAKTKSNQLQQQQAAPAGSGSANSLPSRPPPPGPRPLVSNVEGPPQNLLTSPFSGADGANALNQGLPNAQPMGLLGSAPGAPQGQPPPPPPPPAPHPRGVGGAVQQQHHHPHPTPSHVQQPLPPAHPRPIAAGLQGQAPVHRARSDANLETASLLLGAAGAANQPQSGVLGNSGSVFGAGFSGQQQPLQQEPGLAHTPHKSLSTSALGQFSQLGDLLDPSPSWQPLGQRSSTKSSWQPFGAGFGETHQAANPSSSQKGLGNAEANSSPDLGMGNLSLNSGLNQLGGFPLWDSSDGGAGNFQGPPGPSLLPGQHQKNALIPDPPQEGRLGGGAANNAFSSFSVNNIFSNSHGMDAAEMSRMLYGTEPEGAPPLSAQQQTKKSGSSQKVDIQLENFLSQLLLSKYIDIFRDNEIDMHALTLMTEADFAELNIPKGPRLKIINNLQAADSPPQHLSGGPLQNTPINSSDNLCKLCMEKQIDVILLNCGHMIACATCANSLCAAKRPCPVCSQEIERFQRIFVS